MTTPNDNAERPASCSGYLSGVFRALGSVFGARTQPARMAGAVVYEVAEKDVDKRRFRVLADTFAEALDSSFIPQLGDRCPGKGECYAKFATPTGRAGVFDVVCRYR